jgi:hypothetical protein
VERNTALQNMGVVRNELEYGPLGKQAHTHEVLINEQNGGHNQLFVYVGVVT